MDCSFKTEKGRFNYRVGGIISQADKLLMMKNSRDPYYYSVGGRVKMHESLEEAVLREIREETGQEARIDRLAFIHENFFISSVTGESFHELCFYYYVELEASPDLDRISYTADGVPERLCLIDLKDLDQENIFPEFFKDGLYKSQEVIHVVDKDYITL